MDNKSWNNNNVTTGRSDLDIQLCKKIKSKWYLVKFRHDFQKAKHLWRFSGIFARKSRKKSLQKFQREIFENKSRDDFNDVTFLK